MCRILFSQPFCLRSFCHKNWSVVVPWGRLGRTQPLIQIWLMRKVCVGGEGVCLWQWTRPSQPYRTQQTSGNKISGNTVLSLQNLITHQLLLSLRIMTFNNVVFNAGYKTFSSWIYTVTVHYFVLWTCPSMYISRSYFTLFGVLYNKMLEIAFLEL